MDRNAILPSRTHARTQSQCCGGPPFVTRAGWCRKDGAFHPIEPGIPLSTNQRTILYQYFPDFKQLVVLPQLDHDGDRIQTTQHNTTLHPFPPPSTNIHHPPTFIITLTRNNEHDEEHHITTTCNLQCEQPDCVAFVSAPSAPGPATSLDCALRAAITATSTSTTTTIVIIIVNIIVNNQ